MKYHNNDKGIQRWDVECQYKNSCQKQTQQHPNGITDPHGTIIEACFGFQFQVTG